MMLRTEFISGGITARTGAFRCEADIGAVCAVNAGQWPLAERISQTIRRGPYSVTMRVVVTKGDHPRSIRVPVQLAQEIRTWIDGKRKTYALPFYKANDRTHTDPLFLSDAPRADGNPVSGQTV